MKFNKKLIRVIEKYQKHIDLQYWFDYKRLKKMLKDAYALKRKDVCEHINECEDMCCICLDNDNLMKTFCCHNTIHHTCFVKVLCSTIAKCPMCRAPMEKTLMYHTDIECYNSKIIALICVIQLNINKIESVYKKKLVPQKYLRKYCYYNYMAVVKITKKIDKYLHTNIKDHFMQIVKDKNIYHELQENTEVSTCFTCIFRCEKNKSIF
jgi:hypothetical protein